MYRGKVRGTLDLSMFVIKDSIHIDAPIERCFLLSTSVELVARTLGMKPVAGKRVGLVRGGDQLEWRGWKFGLPQRHETLITKFEPPEFFEDAMASGRFKSFAHMHEFTAIGGQVLLKDTVRFEMPLGFAGRLVGKYVLVPHIRYLLQQRFQLLKRTAESEEWRKYI
jgi:ligand-binding SRPBCC domain-containing protein